MKRGLLRAGIVGLSTVVAASMTSGLAVATPTFSFDRLAGADRYGTSVAIGTAYGASTNVILANGETGHFPDALTASYLAGNAKAPILLTRLAATPANVLARIAASGAKDVWLIGGTGAISAAQATALSGAGYTVHRLGGADRYATSKLVIDALGTAASATKTAVLATGVDFPDAIAGGPLSYVKGMPLAITRTSSLPAETLSALKGAGVTNVIALGGPTVITQAVLDTLAANGITLNQRIFGSTRAETSSLLADYMLTSQGFSNTGVNLASGYRYGGGADALGGAALSGKENRPTLITFSNTTAGAGVTAYMTAHAPTLASGHIFGGTGAVSAAVEAELTAAARSGSASGSISFASTTAAQGGALTGTVVDPASVTNVAVVGCGITNSDVTVSASGAFSLLVPASQAAGSCNLVFTVTKTNGTILTQTVPITVTAIAKGVTAAPDLISVTIPAGTNNVVYTFDSPLATVDNGLNPSSFHVYGANGTQYNPLQITSSGSTVTARFASLELTTTATVDIGAVRDANGRPNPVNALPLKSITLAIGKTNAPNLVSVGNPGAFLGTTTFDFTFDASFVTPVNAGNFCVVSVDGQTFCGNGAPVYNVAKTIATVEFQSLDFANVPVSQVVRGATITNAVVDTAGRFNPTQTAKVNTGVTTAPDLLSVAVIGTNTVRYVFDQPVQGNNANAFVVYNSTGTAGMETNGIAVAPVNGNAAAVDVTFPAGVVADAVGTSIGCDMGGCAVFGTTGTTQPNAVDAMGLQSITYLAGRTALPDLVSVAKSTDAFNVTRVSYTFDDSMLGAPLNAGLFSMYDGTGAQFLSTVAGTLSTDGKTVTVTNGFTPAQLAAAILGGVDANPGSDPVGATPAFPEGLANIG